MTCQSDYITVVFSPDTSEEKVRRIIQDLSEAQEVFFVDTSGVRRSKPTREATDFDRSRAPGAP